MAQTPAPRPDWLEPRVVSPEAPKVFRVRLHTTKGPVVLKVIRRWSPAGADRFYRLVQAGFYDRMPFFRVLTAYIAQFGASARPELQRVWSQQQLPDEPLQTSNRRGTLSYASAGPGTRTTQVFVNLSKTNYPLDDLGFTPFARVVSGMKVLDSLYGGYAEGVDYVRLQTDGELWLQQTYPALDWIERAEVIN